jgi:hypothetical protein
MVFGRKAERSDRLNLVWFWQTDIPDLQHFVDNPSFLWGSSQQRQDMVWYVITDTIVGEDM